MVFFATKKSGKLSQGHTCCQIFTTDKGFLYIVPMKYEYEVLQAMKEFEKDTGSHDAIICDAASNKKSKSLWKFLGEIGTSLQVLEEGTPGENKAELYIGLIIEVVLKDMKDYNSTLNFLGYCVEWQAYINNLTAKSMFKLYGSNPHTTNTGDYGYI